MFWKMPYIKLGVTVFEYSTAICEEFLMKSKGIENYQKFRSVFIAYSLRLNLRLLLPEREALGVHNRCLFSKIQILN